MRSIESLLPSMAELVLDIERSKTSPLELCTHRSLIKCYPISARQLMLSKKLGGMNLTPLNTQPQLSLQAET